MAPVGGDEEKYMDIHASFTDMVDLYKCISNVANNAYGGRINIILLIYDERRR